MILTGTRKQMQAAIDKARARGGAKLVTYRGGFAYDVVGTDTAYRVWWQADNVKCGCTAGANGRVCYHVAAVWLCRMGQESLVRGAGVAA